MEEKGVKNKIITRLDVIVIAVITVILVVLSLFVAAPKSAVSSATVYVGGEKYLTLPLNVDKVYKLKTEYGFNEITVKGGKVFVSDADCRDKICMTYFGDGERLGMIICLPHRLTVILEQGGEIDGVTG